MALPTREDFQRMENAIATRLDRLIELAEQGAFTLAAEDEDEDWDDAPDQVGDAARAHAVATANRAAE